MGSFNDQEDDGIHIMEEPLKIHYVNAGSAAITATEIRLLLEQITGKDGNPSFQFVMTPECAKAVHFLLGRAVTLFESRFGKIRNVDQLIDRQPEVREASVKAGVM